MKKIILFFLLIVLVFVSRPMWEEYVTPYIDLSFMDTVTEPISKMIENPKVTNVTNTMEETVQSFVFQLDHFLSERTSEAPMLAVDKEKLKTPTDAPFSIHNIQLGDSKEEVEKEAGKANRETENDYGVFWHAHHDNYRNFFMVSYDKNSKVNGLFTNQDLVTSNFDIAINTPIEKVREQLDEPITKLRKGLTYYILQANEEYDLYLLDDFYITVFYDKHEGNTVTAIQIIEKSLEDRKKDLYAVYNPTLKEGFEYQLFDLTNAARVNHGLSVLTWDDHVKTTARKHSDDMAKNDYFNHTNLKEQSPFDRMLEDGIYFTYAGENLAYGQYSSIFAHEGLMNSLGHRENILNKDFSYLGVGVAFNEEAQPYYTENFYDK